MLFFSNVDISRKPRLNVIQRYLSYDIPIDEERFEVHSDLDDIFKTIDLNVLPWYRTFSQTNNKQINFH